MKLEGERILCRFHLTNFVRSGLQPLYEVIVETARAQHLAGATVLKGHMGFDAHGPILREQPWSASNELPVIVEVVDRQEQIDRLLALVLPQFRSGMITLERARVVLYRSRVDGETAPPESVVRAETPEHARAREANPMQIPEQGVLLRIFIGESDEDQRTGRPLYEALVLRAREMHLAGATVLRGPMGFGKHSRLHTSKLLELSHDLPIVIELVDAEAKIQDFLPVVDELVAEGLVTIEKVRVLKYSAGAGRDA
jgi:PII-like signaling protein